MLKQINKYIQNHFLKPHNNTTESKYVTSFFLLCYTVMDMARNIVKQLLDFVQKKIMEDVSANQSVSTKHAKTEFRDPK